MMRDDLKVSKGLVFTVMALLGVGRMPAKGGYEQEVMRVFYVAPRRVTQRLVIEGGWGVWAKLMHQKGTEIDTFEIVLRCIFATVTDFPKPNRRH